MNVVVCIKQVPEAPTFEIDPQTNTLIRARGKMIVNPFDMYALEEGVRLKERYGGQTTAITMGPPEAHEALREAIALGIDSAILFTDPSFEGCDTLATSYVLAKAINKLGQPDLIICGRQTTDGDTGQVAPQLAEGLGLPFASYVTKIEEVTEKHMKLQRMADSGHQVIEMALPAVISVVKEINAPRLPSLRGLMQAKKAQIPNWSAQDLAVEASKVGSAGSATRVKMVFFPQRAGGSELLQGSPESQVDQLLERLRGAKVI
ncbi:MAG: electron transfer flavoprotein subunit beta/FixA family protein [Chloroflexi bacterium]|nr:electron transfer flavoprotein subunit beta/FixA family protein [Chloroflexota bacterium]